MKKTTNKTKEPHMIVEIREQVEVVEKLLDRYVGFNVERVNFLELAFYNKKLKKINRFVFLGCGSSAYASLLGNYYFEEFTKKNCEYESATEFITRKAVLGPGTAVVLLSQSGKTKDVLLAAEIARDKGAFVIAITNTPGSRLARLADVAIDSKAGIELGIAATKSFSSQLLILLLMSIYFADMYRVKIAKRGELFKELEKLSANIDKTLENEKEIEKLAKNLIRKNNLLVVGRKYNFPIALEGAHKIKETAYIHAEGLASEELRHGGEAMLDKSFTVISLIPGDSVYKDNLVLLKELKKIKVNTVALSDKNTKGLKDLVKKNILIPKTRQELMVFVTLISMQMMAFYLAKAKKIDINKPRNITKFVA